jgi:hypothetical protein
VPASALHAPLSGALAVPGRHSSVLTQKPHAEAAAHAPQVVCAGQPRGAEVDDPPLELPFSDEELARLLLFPDEARLMPLLIPDEERERPLLLLRPLLGPLLLLLLLLLGPLPLDELELDEEEPLLEQPPRPSKAPPRQHAIQKPVFTLPVLVGLMGPP